MLSSMIVSKIYSNSRAYGSDPDPGGAQPENHLEDAYTLRIMIPYTAGQEISFIKFFYTKKERIPGKIRPEPRILKKNTSVSE